MLRALQVKLRVALHAPPVNAVSAPRAGQVHYHMEELHQAAAQRDVSALHRTAQRLKQMTLCHSPTFDLLAISAYR